MSTASMDLPVLFLRTVWLFQAIVAGPIFVFLGILTLGTVFEAWDTIYYFVLYFFTALLAGAVILLVLVQRKITGTPRRLTVVFEIAKSVLATAVWLWWLLDAVLGPHRRYYNQTIRIEATAIAVILLCVLFYPPLIYALTFLKDQEADQGRIALPADEGGVGSESAA